MSMLITHLGHVSHFIIIVIIAVYYRIFSAVILLESLEFLLKIENLCRVSLV